MRASSVTWVFIWCPHLDPLVALWGLSTCRREEDCYPGDPQRYQGAKRLQIGERWTAWPKRDCWSRDATLPRPVIGRGRSICSSKRTRHTRLSVDDLGLLAEVAYAAGHLDVTIVAWERAHADAVRAGDSLAAADAATRVALHLLMDTALMAPIRGWVRRAERLLEGHDDSPTHAWLALIKCYDFLMRGDLPAARGWATRAIGLGSIGNPAAAAIGRVAEAHAVILAGEVGHGLDLVEEAGVAAISGELDAVSTGMLYCELVCMLQGLGQYDLAAEWTEAMERWSRASAYRQRPWPMPRAPGRDPPLAWGDRRRRAGGLGGLRGAAALPAAGVRLAPDRAGPHPTPAGRPARGGGGVPVGSGSRVGSGAGTRPGTPGSRRRYLGCGSHP